MLRYLPYSICPATLKEPNRQCVQYILLVGGFGESKYLQQVLRGAFSSKTCDLTVIDDGTCVAGPIS